MSEGKSPTRRYLDDDWELWWWPDGPRPWIKVRPHPARIGEIPSRCLTWGGSSGCDSTDSESARRHAIARQAWDIVDDGVPLAEVQATLAELDLELMRTARIMRIQEDEGGEE